MSDTFNKAKEAISYFPALTLLIIVLSFIGNYMFYGAFNIDITQFFKIGDYINLFFSDMVLLFMIAAGMYLIIYLQTSFSIRESTSIGEVSYSGLLKAPLKLSKSLLVITILFLVMLVLLFIRTRILNVFLSTVVLSVYGFLLLVLIQIIFIRNKYEKNRYGYESLFKELNKKMDAVIVLGIIALIIYYLFLIKSIDIQNIRKCKPTKYIYEFVLDDERISTTDSTIFYLGSSDDYHFLYDRKSEISRVIDKSTVHEVKVRRNLRYNKNIILYN